MAALKSIFAGILILALALLARPILVRALRLKTVAPSAQPHPAVPPPRSGPGRSGRFADADDAIINVRRVEDRVKAASARRVAALLDRHPDLAAKAMRRWLAEGSNSR